MSVPILLLRVAASWPLPGLGLLVLPAQPTSALAAYALHSALAVEVWLPNCTVLQGKATVEEITRPAATAEPAQRALLLDLDGAVVLPPGTEIRLAEPLS